MCRLFSALSSSPIFCNIKVRYFKLPFSCRVCFDTSVIIFFFFFFGGGGGGGGVVRVIYSLQSSPNKSNPDSSNFWKFRSQLILPNISLFKLYLKILVSSKLERRIRLIQSHLDGFFFCFFLF